MKINKIEIDNFGKLENYSFIFDDGINIIYGNNEDGKSTIMAFIKMMFYGSTGRSTDLLKNIRKKYMPWNGAKMSGAIEFEDKEVKYRVEKRFGASNATDKINLWNQITGEKEKIASATDIGQRFFGIGAAAFEKSVFISQIGSTISSDGDKEDEITQKLLNLVSTGDESVSQKKVGERLRLAKEALKSKSGKIGILDKLNKKSEDLSNQKIVSLEDEETKKQLQEEYISLGQEEEKLKNTYELNKFQLYTQEKLEELGKLESLISKKQHIDNLLTECNSKNEQRKVGDIIFDSEFVKTCEEDISYAQTLERLYLEKNKNVELLEGENVKLKADKVGEISKEYIETVKAKQRDKNVCQKAIDTLKSSIKEINEFVVKREKGQATLLNSEKKLVTITKEKQKEQNNISNLRLETLESEKNVSMGKENFENQNKILNTIKSQKEDANTKYLVAINNTKYVKQLSNQKVDSAKEELKQVSTARQAVSNENMGRAINKQLFFGSIVILVTSVILGVAINPICYAGVVVAIVLGIVACGKKKIKTTTNIIIDQVEVNEAQKKLETAESDRERENHAACLDEQMVEKVLNELVIKAESLQKEVSKLQQKYTDSNLLLSQAKQKIKEIQVKLEFIDEKISGAQADAEREKSEFEQLINSNIEVKNMDIQKLCIQLEEKVSDEIVLKDNIDKLLMDKNCNTTDELQSKHIEWKNYETRLFAKAEELQKAVKSSKQAKESLAYGAEKLFQAVGKYTKVNSFETATKAIDELNNVIDDISKIDIKISSQTDILNNEIKGKTVQQLNKEMDDVRVAVLMLNDGIMPLKCDDSQIELLKQSNERIQSEIQNAKERVMQLKLTIKNKFVGKKNVSEVDTQIYQLKEEILEKHNYYECLDIAESTINEAFNEISQSFGPLLNSKTTEIFNSLTEGKYKNVIISRNFDINVQNTESVTSHEWKYLSNGTIDQAYFALRLAISDLFSKKDTRLPLMLDDVFLQYDEERAKQGLKFLVDYSKSDEVSTQIIMFTCQKGIINLAKKNNSEIVIKNIIQ